MFWAAVVTSLNQVRVVQKVILKAAIYHNFDHDEDDHLLLYHQLDLRLQ
jgi:hypothetical protein